MERFHGCCFRSARPSSASKPDHGHAGTGIDDGFEIFKVKVDHAVGGQKFSNARDGADEQFIPDSEGTCNGQVFDAFNFQQAFVRYDKDGIAMLS